MANKMSSTEDILDTEDTIAMDLDTETQETNDEGTSRPATSIISDFSVPESIDDNDQDEEEDQDNEVNGGWIPASVHPNKALSDSYIHVSPRPSADGPFIVGVDEAGRGPALGPMVYGMAFCPEEFVDELKGIGFDDSKTLTHETRVGLLKALSQDPANLGWAVNILSPQAISSSMLAHPPINLNQQSQNATITLLKTLLDPPYSLPISSVFVDALGPAEKYEVLLQKRFPTLKITVRNKADSLFKIVGAASCAAKVTRDFLVENWIWEETAGDKMAASNLPKRSSSKELPKVDGRPTVLEGQALWGTGKELGSGYPSDPKTKAWIQKSLDKTFGFPTIARFSWAPIRTALEQGGHQVQWIDEGQKTLVKAFESVSGNDKGRSFIARELSVSSVSAL